MKKGWIWAVFPFAVLGLSMGFHLVFIALAASDPTLAVEEDYYQKGLDWDKHVAQVERNRELGWTLDLAFDRRGLNAAERVGSTGVEVRLADRGGKSIAGAVVHLAPFHHGRPRRLLEAPLDPAGPGVYRVALPMRRTGIWAFRFRVERGRDVFTKEISRHVSLP